MEKWEIRFSLPEGESVSNFSLDVRPVPGQMLRSVFVRGVSMADAVIKAEATQRPTTSRFLFKALMIIVISYPVLDGALVTMRQMSNLVDPNIQLV